MPEETVVQNPAAPVLDASTQEAPLPEVEGKTSPDPQAESEQADNEQQDDKKRRNYIPQWRLDEITREKHEERRARESAERRADEAERELNQVRGKSTQAAPSGLPAHLQNLNAFLLANPNFTTMDEAEQALHVARDKANRDIWHREQQEQEFKRHAEQLFTNFSEKVKQLPEYAEVAKAKESFGKDVIAYIEGQAAGAGPFGPQAYREILLDPELSAHLQSLDKIKNGVGITALVNAVAAGLLVKSKESAKVEDKTPASAQSQAATKYPPPQDKGRASGADPTALRDDLPMAEWEKRFAARLAAHKG